MKKDPDPRKHHIVPVTYLELFMIPTTDKVAILDLKTGNIWKQKPNEVLHRRDYYRQEHGPSGKDQFILEKGLGKIIENNLQNIINKLIDGGNRLSEDELIQFINHLQLQRLRVPKQFDFFMNSTSDLLTQIALSIPEVASGMREYGLEVVVKNEYRFSILKQLLESGMLFTLFSRMIWNVWTIPPGHTLVTTDNPVVIFNPYMHGEKISGPGLLGAHVLFPLSPQYLLEMIHPEIESDPNTDPLSRIQVQKFEVSQVQIRAGNILSENRANKVNSLMALHADRFVVSENEDELKAIWFGFNK